MWFNIPCSTSAKIGKKLNRPVDKFELFEHTSKSQKSGTFSTQNPKNLVAKVGCMDSSSPGFDLPVWSNLVGGPSKGCLYGVGRSQIAECHSAASINTPFRGESNEEISRVDDTIQATISKLEEDF